MRRKNDAYKDDLEGVAQRLGDERPQASPLELDQIKRTAMSRAKAATGGRPFGARRLAVAGLTAGLLAAGTGGVIAGTSGGGTGGNAAVAQYSSSACDTHNNNDNNNGNGEGSENNNNNNNFNCNNGSFNNSGNNSGNTTNTTTNTITYNSSTVTLTAGTSANSGVQASKQSKASASKRHFSVHFFAGNGKKLRKLTVRLNGKVIKVYRGRIPSTLDFVGVPCGNVKQHLVITGETTSGKKISETRHYNLCQ